MTRRGRRRPPVEVASPAELERIAGRLGAAITDTHPDGVVLVGVLKGCVPFLADLCRHVHSPVDVEFLAISPFHPDHGTVAVLHDVGSDLAGRDVVVVEDIVDTGLTLTYLLDLLGSRSPASLEVATLIDRTARRLVPVQLDLVGLTLSDEFVVGYGLDFAGRYRNLPALWSVESGALAADADSYVMDLYGA